MTERWCALALRAVMEDALTRVPPTSIREHLAAVTDPRASEQTPQLQCHHDTSCLNEACERDWKAWKGGPARKTMRTLHDAYVSVCSRKVPYEELAAAEAVAERLTRLSEYGELLTVYRCPFAPMGEGGHFHVGHVRGTKPKAKLLRAKRRWSEPRITFRTTMSEASDEAS